MASSSWNSYRDIFASGKVKMILGNVFLNQSPPSPCNYNGHYAFSSFPPVTTFVPRPSLRDKIHEQLTRERTQDDGQGPRIVVVWGLGGAGKSQLVRSYLQQHKHEYSASFWIEACRKETIERAFREIYHLLFKVTTDGDLKSEDAVLAVKNWFIEREGRWLFVFDGADGIDSMDANEEADDFVDIRHFIPDKPSIDVILTTRSSSAEGLTALEMVKVAEMKPREAAKLFKNCSKIDDKGGNEAAVKEIVEELGYFALAVSLSGTYVCNTPRLKLHLGKYLDEYQTRRKEILARKPNSLVHQYGESVLTTWETTFDAVTQKCIQTSKLLTLLGFINFDDIFIDLFVPTSQGNGYEQNGENGAVVAWYDRIFEGAKPDVHTIENNFEILQSYGLLQWKSDQSYTMHKLVHAWALDRLLIDDQRSFVLPSLRLLFNAISKAGHKPEARQRLVPHIMANFKAVSKANLEDSDREVAVRLFSTSGNFLYNAGHWVKAYSIQDFVYSETLKMWGDSNQQTISAMSNLASTLGDQGKLEEAAAMRKE
ncbi:uncharacterized protein BDR25DRAFT_351526, partial [Lindgomyces ingoldianus]